MPRGAASRHSLENRHAFWSKIGEACRKQLATPIHVTKAADCTYRDHRRKPGRIRDLSPLVADCSDTRNSTCIGTYNAPASTREGIGEPRGLC